MRSPLQEERRTTAGGGWGGTDSSRDQETGCSDNVRLLSQNWAGLAGHGGRRKSILVFIINTKIFHRGKVVLPGIDLVLVVLHGGLAQVALEAGPGEAGGDTAQERQEGTVLDLLETYGWGRRWWCQRCW